MSENNLLVTAATCSQQPVSDIVQMRAIEVPASSYCDNHLDWHTSYIAIVILQQLCFVFHSYQSCCPANDSVVKTDLENCREALPVSEVCPSQTRHLASVSVMLFRSCHLILMLFVSSTNYLRKLRSLSQRDDLQTISVDCIITIPASDYRFLLALSFQPSSHDQGQLSRQTAPPPPRATLLFHYWRLPMKQHHPTFPPPHHHHNH